MATSLRLSIRPRTTVATATRLPLYARNDGVGSHEPPSAIDLPASVWYRRGAQTNIDSRGSLVKPG